MEDNKPVKQRFKDPSLQRMYENARREAQNPSSELFNKDGSPRRGALHRSAYWDGRCGVKSSWRTDSLAYAAWAAGQDDLEDFGPIEGSEYKLGSTM
jgi:hypothetical protein